MSDGGKEWIKRYSERASRVWHDIVSRHLKINDHWRMNVFILLFSRA